MRHELSTNFQKSFVMLSYNVSSTVKRSYVVHANSNVMSRVHVLDLGTQDGRNSE